MAGSTLRTVRVLTFAGARDVVGAPEVEIDLPSIGDASTCTAKQVMDALCLRYPELVSRRAIIRLAVNGSYVDDDAEVAGGDEVALIPPVAGG